MQRSWTEEDPRFLSLEYLDYSFRPAWSPPVAVRSFRCGKNLELLS